MAQSNDGTIDITNFVEWMRATFVLSTVTGLLADLVTVPGIGPTIAAIPIFNAVAKKIIEWAVTKVANRAEMTAFFMNTAIRKAWQAGDYTEAVKRKNALPEDVDDETWEKAELLEIQTFSNFVAATN
jgi:hypothetical protein